MKNQKEKEIQKLFLSTLQKLLNYKQNLDQRLLDYQFDVFQSIIIDLTGTEKLLFNTLFARIAFLGIQHKLPGRFIYELHLYRKENANLSVFKKYEELYRLGLYLIRRILQDIYGVDISRELIQSTSKPDYKKIEIEMESFRHSMRGLISSLSQDGQSFVFIEEENAHEEKVLKTDHLELFQNSLAQFKLWSKKQQLPVLVDLKDVGIAKDGVIYPKWMIIEPDYLVDVTAIAECFMPNGARASYYLLKKFIPAKPSKYLLIGHIVNYILDEMIHNPAIEFNTVLHNIFRLSPLSFTLLDDAQIVEIVNTVKSHFLNLKRVLSEDFPKLDLHPGHCIVEPSFYAPGYGLQGRLDVLYQKNDQQSSIIELKSGSPFRENMYGLSVNHYTQTLLYDLMIRSVLKQNSKPLNYILYSKLSNQNLRFAPTVQAAQMEAISIRNDIIILEKQLINLQPQEFYFDKLRLENFPGAFGFMKDDIERFELMYQSLEKVEKAYFNAFASFISTEHHLAKIGYHDTKNNKGLASLWLESSRDKENRFALFSALEIVKNNSLEEAPLITLKKTKNSNELANFRVGDIVVLRPMQSEDSRGLDNQVLRSSLIALSGDEMVIKLRSKQYNQSIFSSHSLWNLESDFLDSGFRKMYQSLFEFGIAEKRKRMLILGREKPEEPQREFEPDIPDHLSDSQKAVLNSLLESKDYYLLWGPPGTGKTAVILRYAIQNLFAKTKQNILLLAYTNKAVDEICETLEKIGDKVSEHYIRIGSQYASGEKFRDRLLDVQLNAIPNRKILKEKIDDTRIFVATISSILGKAELFLLKKFETVFIDEASQILEPMLVGLLSKFEKFVMIGDHRQLPAVVVQHKSISETDNKLLNEIGIFNRRNALFERLFLRCQKMGWDSSIGQLYEQGRMHEKIQAFSNAQFYHNTLTCLGNIPRLKSKLSSRYAEKYLDNVLTNQRMLFYATELDKSFALAKNNRAEAELTAKLVRELIVIYAESSIELTEDSIGIITPFRAQIAQIRESFRQHAIPLDKITIDTVERYQGGARDIIIFSTSVNSVHRLNQLVSQDEAGVDRKLNVAVTRAKEQFIILGNKTILRNNELYRNLITACIEVTE